MHVHNEQNTSDSARVFEPAQEKAAKKYVASTESPSLRGLTNFLLKEGFAAETLPDSKRRSKWLSNHKPKPQSAFAKAAPPRSAVFARSLEQWPTIPTEHAA